MTEELMLSLFHGALRVEHTEKGYEALRFSPAILNEWTNRRAGWGVRARCTCGISLAFYTDAEIVRMPFSACNFSRVFVGFDIYENGILSDHIEFPDSCEGGTLEYKTKNPGEKLVEIYLSCLNQIIVQDIEAGNITPAYENPHRVLFIGDSITQGMTAKYPSLTYPTLYARKKGMQVINLGVGGAKFESWQLEDFPEYDFERVFVAYGINDLCSGEAVDELLHKARDFLKKLIPIADGKPVTVITPIWNRAIPNEEGFLEKFTAYSAKLSEYAYEFGFVSVDGMKLMPPDPRFTFDGTHPVESGFALMTVGLL